jgi:hypothetical protein
MKRLMAELTRNHSFKRGEFRFQLSPRTPGYREIICLAVEQQRNKDERQKHRDGNPRSTKHPVLAYFININLSHGVKVSRASGSRVVQIGFALPFLPHPVKVEGRRGEGWG